MRTLDLVSFSLQSFKNRKSRMILTVLGVAVAIGVILFLVSLGYGLQKVILERITTEDSLLTLDVFPPDTDSLSITSEIVDQIEQNELVAVVSPQAVVTAQLTYDGLTAETLLNIVRPDFFRLSGLSVDPGEHFSNDGQKQVVISPVVAELFAVTDPNTLIGQSLVLTFVLDQYNEQVVEGEGVEPAVVTDSFVVVGVAADQSLLNQVYINQSSLATVELTEFQFLKVQVASQNNLETVRAMIIEQGFLVSALSDVVFQANQIFSIIQIVLAIFGIFSLFVAAIGLVNTMTISLLERINEIGIMRAIGASKWDIRKIFLIESTLIGFFGGVVGIALGFLMGGIFNGVLFILARTLGGQPVAVFHTPLWFIFFVLLFSAGVGLIAGVMPAQKAARLNALEALRYK